MYADAVSARGAPLQNCFGFVDGTVRPIARPGEHQRLVYNGHKRVHSLNFQSLALPNGLIANMYGPLIGEENILRNNGHFNLHVYDFVHSLAFVIFKLINFICYLFID